jgi:hypothetical protein
MLPKIPDRANVTGNACAAAAIEVEASSGMTKLSSLNRRGVGEGRSREREGGRKKEV